MRKVLVLATLAAVTVLLGCANSSEEKSGTNGAGAPADGG